jgi:hypothetical protein
MLKLYAIASKARPHRPLQRLFSLEAKLSTQKVNLQGSDLDKYLSKEKMRADLRTSRVIQDTQSKQALVSSANMVQSIRQLNRVDTLKKFYFSKKKTMKLQDKVYLLEKLNFLYQAALDEKKAKKRSVVEFKSESNFYHTLFLSMTHTEDLNDLKTSNL